MRFFVGLHQPSDARHFDASFVSVNRLRKRKSDFAVRDWILDSGAFSTITTHGGYPEPPDYMSSTLPAVSDPFSSIVQIVLDSVTSPQSKRAYRKAIGDFFSWCQLQESTEFSKATVQRYRATLLESSLSASTINQKLTAIRKLAREAGDNAFLSHQIAEGIQHVPNVKKEGVRTGNWLTLQQAEFLLSIPDVSTLAGKRDRALLAVLIGCGLRREEAANLKREHIQLRDARWVIVDLVGKGNRVRTVPMPAWCKLAIDSWVQEREDDFIFRPVNKGDNLTPETRMTAQSIFQTVKKLSKEAGLGNIAPHDLRRTFAKLAHKGRAQLEQIQLSLGHASIITTERYLGVQQDLVDAPCDHLGIKA